MTPVLEGKNIVRDYYLPGGLFKKARPVHAVASMPAWSESAVV